MSVVGADSARAADGRPCSACLCAGCTGCTPRSLSTRNREAEQQLVLDMAKEGADMTEETEYMIDKNVKKEMDNVETTGNAKEMRAVILSGFGGLNKLRVTKKAMPEPQDGEVKIRVKTW